MGTVFTITVDNASVISGRLYGEKVTRHGHFIISWEVLALEVF